MLSPCRVSSHNALRLALCYVIQLNGQGGGQTTWLADLWLPADCHLWLIMSVLTVSVCYSAAVGMSSLSGPWALFSQTSQHSTAQPPASSQQVKTSLLTCCKLVASCVQKSCQHTRVLGHCHQLSSSLPFFLLFDTFTDILYIFLCASKY